MRRGEAGATALPAVVVLPRLDFLPALATDTSIVSFFLAGESLQPSTTRRDESDGEESRRAL
jgi:hypothetical protein